MMSDERLAEIRKVVTKQAGWMKVPESSMRTIERELLAEVDRLRSDPVRQAAADAAKAWMAWCAWCDAPVIHDDSGNTAKDAWVSSMDALVAALSGEHPEPDNG